MLRAMFEGYRVGAVLLMGGVGGRLGQETPKQFLLLEGKRLYLYALETLQNVGLFDEIILVCHPEWIETVSQETTGVVVIAGGKTRQESSYLGLKGFACVPDVVCMHDAVRPFVSEKMLRENVAQALIHGAVDTCIPSADTLVYAPDGQHITSIPKRAEYLRGQTPQTFLYPIICSAHQAAEHTHNVTDDCALILRQGHPVHVVIGSEQNLKITTHEDLLLAKLLIQQRRLRSAQANRSQCAQERSPRVVSRTTHDK